MNYNLVIIVVLVINLLALSWIIYQNYNKNLQVLKEGFSSDEAIQNIASLYNQGKLEVTDFTSTGTATLGTANITNVNAQSITDASVGSTMKVMRDNLQGQITALKTYVEGPLTQWIIGQDNLRVSKGPINLVASYNYDGNSRTNWPVLVSDNYFLRAHPNASNNQTNVGATFSIL